MVGAERVLGERHRTLVVAARGRVGALVARELARVLGRRLDGHLRPRRLGRNGQICAETERNQGDANNREGSALFTEFGVKF